MKQWATIWPQLCILTECGTSLSLICRARIPVFSFSASGGSIPGNTRTRGHVLPTPFTHIGPFTVAWFGPDFQTFHFDLNQNCWNPCETSLGPRSGSNSQNLSLTKRGGLGPDQTQPWFGSFRSQCEKMFWMVRTNYRKFWQAIVRTGKRQRNWSVIHFSPVIQPVIEGYPLNWQHATSDACHL